MKQYTEEGKKRNIRKKIIPYLTYGTLIIGAAVGLYAFAGIYLMKSRLPSGACPVNSNRPLLYIAIALCCISFILSFFEPKDRKKDND